MIDAMTRDGAVFVEKLIAKDSVARLVLDVLEVCYPSSESDLGEDCSQGIAAFT